MDKRYARFLMAAGLLLMPTALAAQNAPPGGGTQTGSAAIPDLDSSSFFDFGYRGTIYGSNSDEARYQRYRDLRNGPTYFDTRISPTPGGSRRKPTTSATGISGTPPPTTTTAR